MSAVTRSLRSATKQLRVQPQTTRLFAAPLTVRSASFGAATRTTSTSYKNFSTTAAARSGAPAMASSFDKYDPEIRDIADYVANKSIDSELAVSALPLFFVVALPRATVGHELYVGPR